MIIRSSELNDSQNILSLMTKSYSKNRFDENYSKYWANCFINSPLIFPSFVAINDNSDLVGYIVWRVKQLNENHVLTIELQELTAINGSEKLGIEKLLFEESPKRSVELIKRAGINVEKKCNIDILIHHQDIENNKSILYDSVNDGKGIFLGALEKSDARGEMLRLYRKELEL